MIPKPTRTKRRPLPLPKPRVLAHDTATHEARLELARYGEPWGDAVFAIRIAPFADDVAEHLDDLTLTDLLALQRLGQSAAHELKCRQCAKGNKND